MTVLANQNKRQLPIGSHFPLTEVCIQTHTKYFHFIPNLFLLCRQREISVMRFRMTTLSLRLFARIPNPPNDIPIKTKENDSLREKIVAFVNIVL